ncbi:MAG: hypothetical protein JNK48_25145 [Bryobacterales bacterium]|nr:hypothetical protein [Bryobacterales bacterium]
MRVLWLVPLGIAAFGADLSGKWQVHRSAAGRESTQECTLAQKGGELSGSCKGDRGTVEVKGKVEGSNATWTYTAESEGGTVTVVYKGTVESEKKISGTVTAVEFSVEGEFTATLLN